MKHRFPSTALSHFTNLTGLLAALFCLALPATAADAVSVNSPDGHIQFRVVLDKQGSLTYAVTLRAKPAIETSPLGIVVDGVNLTQGVQVGRTDRYKVNETYSWHGVHSTIAVRASGVRIALAHEKSGARYTLETRAYNDGIAFRFIVPGAIGKSRVPDEATTFRLPAGSTVWYHDFEGHYEGAHVRKRLQEVHVLEWAAPPLTVKLPNGAGYASITEGALRHYPGMGLQADGKGSFEARLGHSHPPSYPFRLRFKDEIERLAKPASVEGVITTPWRIVMAGLDLNTLVNCDIVHDVAPPADPKLFPQGMKTEWIKPGRAVWRYLDGGETTLEGIKEFSRLAGALGFEYQVVEGFWAKWSQSDLKDLIDYSRSQGVGIWLWKHSRDLRDPESRRKFFRLCRDAGAAGVKLDFYDHEAKEVVELYEASLKEAAEYKLLVNFHGANKPTGESRTFPNEMTREGILGMESRKTLRAHHDATLPFTRMLAGHADYTPVLFGERRNDTTWAHQVASAAVFTSPLLTYGAHPGTLLQHPAVDVIKSIPSVWDETIALPISEIGEIAAFARRRGDRWFLAILNGPAAKTVDVPLSFLGPGKYNAVLVRDAATAADAVDIGDGAYGRGQSLRIALQAGGGFIGRFSK
jgi:alpha-glucosidase